ncbi:SDR family oxidoreductase [Glacieibacterium sp.]|uniref:SDR family oxidoreductase n=1 Tax=Glacieibacterium sp. TaxID=2860237 RepID=UPI003B00B67B
MIVTGNTILITGGASGIGRALAEEFHKLGNTVVIAGRGQAALDEVTAANPGMASIRLDIGDAAGIETFAAELVERFPGLNAVINNAGIMVPEDVKAGGYLATAEATIATNLLGPIRLTAALLPHLLEQPRAAVLTVSSGLAFLPLAATPTYSATKAAIHSYSMSLRHQLAGTSVEVIEIAPPYVQTGLMGPHQHVDPAAMPLADFAAEVMAILTDQPDAAEVIVGRCAPLRFAAERGTFQQMFDQWNRAH